MAHMSDIHDDRLQEYALMLRVSGLGFSATLPVPQVFL